MQVVSLHPLGRQLRGCCAASYTNRILVYETHVSNSVTSNIQVRSQAAARTPGLHACVAHTRRASPMRCRMRPTSTC